MALTKKQKEFCEELIENGYKQWEAYHKVYPDACYDACKTNACRLMKKPEIQEYIAKLQDLALKRAAVSPARVIKKLSDIAFAENDGENYTTATSLKAIELLMKNFGLDKKVIDANIATTIIEVKVDEDE